MYPFSKAHKAQMKSSEAEALGFFFQTVIMEINLNYATIVKDFYFDTKHIK